MSIYDDERSSERQFMTMHGHLNINLSRCTVTRTSIYHDAWSPERQFITMNGHRNVKNEIGKIKVVTRKCEEKYELLKYCTALSQFVALTTTLICATLHNEVINWM